MSVTGKAVAPEMYAIRQELEAFKNDHGYELPQPARDALAKFLQSAQGFGTGTELYSASLVVHYAVFRAEFEYDIANREEERKALTELAFVHLRRLIVVDEDVKTKWRAAFAHGERRCEQLGAVHLLHHAIWAFKVSAKGARN